MLFPSRLRDRICALSCIDTYYHTCTWHHIAAERDATQKIVLPGGILCEWRKVLLHTSAKWVCGLHCMHFSRNSYRYYLLFAAGTYLRNACYIMVRKRVNFSLTKLITDNLMTMTTKFDVFFLHTFKSLFILQSSFKDLRGALQVGMGQQWSIAPEWWNRSSYATLYSTRQENKSVGVIIIHQYQ